MKRFTVKILAIIFALALSGLCYWQYSTSAKKYDTYARRHKAGLIYIKEEKYDLAEKALKKAVQLSPDTLDGYAALRCLYIESKNGEMRTEMQNQVDSLGLDGKIVSNVYSAYAIFISSKASYMTNEDNTIFTYYDADGTPLMRNESYPNGDYVKSVYVYGEDGRISHEVMEKHEGLYTWPKVEVPYTYDENGRLVEKNDKTRGLIKYSYDEKGNISEIDYRSKYSTGNGKTPYREIYENGILVKTLSSNGLDRFDTETFYDTDGSIKLQNKLDENGDITKINLFEYNKGEEFDEKICHSYYTDNILDYTQTVRSKRNKIFETVTEYFDSEGGLIKTVTRDADGDESTVLEIDITDDFRPLTKEEIEQVNNSENLFGDFRITFIKPEDMPLYELLKIIPSDDYLTDRDKEELSALKEEGVPLNYARVELELFYYGYYKKVSFDTLENFLNEHLGISYSQLRNKEGELFSKNYNCFYSFVSCAYYSNMGKTDFVCVGGEISKNHLKLYSADRTVIFAIKDGRYILKSVISENHSDFAPENESKPTKTDKTAYTYKLKTDFGLKDPQKGTEYNRAMEEYEKIIRKNSPEETDNMFSLLSFSLYDITKDGIPELIASEVFSYWQIYSYRNGEVVELSVPPECGGDAGKVMFSDGSILGIMDKGYYQSFTYYTYNRDDSVNETDFGITWDYTEEKYHCNINNKDVTEAEYNEFIQKFRRMLSHGTANREYIEIYDKVKSE